MGTQLALVRGDNWQGLYVNGELVLEDHSISPNSLMSQVLHRHVDGWDVFDASNEALDTTGRFPKFLKDVVLYTGKTVGEFWEN